MTSHDRARGGGVEQCRDHAAVEDPVVRAEVFRVGQEQFDGFVVPPPYLDAAVLVERDPVGPVLAEPLPPLLPGQVHPRHPSQNRDLLYNYFSDFTSGSGRRGWTGHWAGLDGPGRDGTGVPL